MGELIIGIVIGAIAVTPIVFLITVWAAHAVWHCVPCVNGQPVKKEGQ